MKRFPDAEATVSFLRAEDGGRSTPMRSGYRPAHRILPDYLTTGEYRFVDTEWVEPGQTARALITFITPEAYPHSLWPGKVLDVQEGGHLVGHATILTVLNPLLLAPEDESAN